MSDEITAASLEGTGYKFRHGRYWGKALSGSDDEEYWEIEIELGESGPQVNIIVGMADHCDGMMPTRVKTMSDLQTLEKFLT